MPTLPRLTDDIMRAACKAHFGSDNIDGINITAHDVDWSFRDAFKRMWSGARTAVDNAEPAPVTLSATGTRDSADFAEGLRAIRDFLDKWEAARP